MRKRRSLTVLEAEGGSLVRPGYKFNSPFFGFILG